MPLTLEIVTPEARVYSDTIDSVVIPTTSGEIGVLPGHIRSSRRWRPGRAHVTKGGRDAQLLAVSGGFARFPDDKRLHPGAKRHRGTEKMIDEQAAWKTP